MTDTADTDAPDGSSPVAGSGRGGALRETARSLGSVFKNPGLRRVQLAFLASAIGDWAYATAVTVWAYSEGGATAVGVFQAVRWIAMAVAAPLGSVVADRVSRKAFMIVLDLVRAGLVVIATLCIALDLSAFTVYGLALVCAVVGAPFRSAQAALIPRLANTPDELTASNATASNLDNVTTFAGPAIGALLIAVTDVEVVFLLNAATFLLSFVLVAGIRVPSRAGDGDPDAGAEPHGEDAQPWWRELSAGYHALATNRDLGIVTLLAAVQCLVWGALTVFMVLMSLQLLDAGAEGVGYLNSVSGAATVLGGGLVLARVRKQRLGQDMVVGVLGWTLPLLMVAAFPSPLTAFAALAVVGFSDPLVNIGLDTIPQRVVPDRVLARVFGAMDSALVGAMALGAFVAPLLIHPLGFRGALLAVGGVATVVALLCLQRMRQVDRRLSAPEALGLVQALPLFAPLGVAIQEQLAHALRRVEAAAGDVVVRQGDDADGFFVIESGLVEVTQGERVLRREGPGEFFGEIGLLRDVPRTATVTAVEDSVLRWLDRRSFLDALSGHSDARRAAEDVASRRLAV